LLDYGGVLVLVSVYLAVLVLLTELSGREMRITTANVVLLDGEGATWREALRGPCSVAGVVRPKQL
jgi:hypothetical protein